MSRVRKSNSMPDIWRMYRSLKNEGIDVATQFGKTEAQMSKLQDKRTGFSVKVALMFVGVIFLLAISLPLIILKVSSEGLRNILLIIALSVGFVAFVVLIVSITMTHIPRKSNIYAQFERAVCQAYKNKHGGLLCIYYDATLDA